MIIFIGGGAFYLCKVSFDQDDLNELIKLDPKNYEELATIYNEAVWGDDLPKSEEVKKDPLVWLEEFKNIDKEEFITFSKPVEDRGKIVYQFRIFSSKSCLDFNAYTPDIVLFDKDLNIKGWIIW